MQAEIKKAFNARKKLIKAGKSKIDNTWALQFIKNYEYWDLVTKDRKNLVQKKQGELVYIAPPNFKKQIELIAVN